MYFPKPDIKAAIWLFWILWSPLVSSGKTIVVGRQGVKEAVSLMPFFSALEDSSAIFTANQLYKRTDVFLPLNAFKLTQPDRTFWLRATLSTDSELNRNQLSILFANLTYVDFYLYKDNALQLHKQAGAFQKKSQICEGDGRFNFNFAVAPHATYTLLLKVKHVKKYPPTINFKLQDTFTYLSNNTTFESINSWLLGAVSILIFYTMISWFITRYRPYLWVLMVLLGVGLYSFALDSSFTDIFFPNHPVTVWLAIFPFMHVGIAGFYLLILDFLTVKRYSAFLYLLGKYLIRGILIFSCFCVLHNYFTSNYYLTNKINLYFSLVHLVFATYTLIFLWRKLDKAQFYLVYGVILFGAAVIFIGLGSYIFNENAFLFSSISTKVTVLAIAMLFLAGLNQKLRQHEQGRFRALQQLNDLQRQHNALIEKKVSERTLELENSNLKLVEKQMQLMDKNHHIETLMDELNHRVKNNLQMLYSLNTLQLPLIKDKKSRQILNEMRGRIKAMMLVNEHLRAFEENRTVMLSAFIQDIGNHIQQIYDRDRRVEVISSIPSNIQFNALVALPFGLILTELFTNVYKHAFPDPHQNPTIRLGLFEQGQKILFFFEDNGQGAQHLVKDSSMGLSLIHDLVRQLKGAVDFRHQKGFSYRFTFSKSS